jgi:hypothetical protein
MSMLQSLHLEDADANVAIAEDRSLRALPKLLPALPALQVLEATNMLVYSGGGVSMAFAIMQTSHAALRQLDISHCAHDFLRVVLGTACCCVRCWG